MLDDLPSVVVAGRLLAQVPPHRRSQMIGEAARSGVEAEAVMLDVAAAKYGQTMEAWAYLPPPQPHIASLSQVGVVSSPKA